MANKNSVDVVRNYTSTVGDFNISRDGDNIVVRNGKNTLTFPNGSMARAILAEASSFVTDEAKTATKRKAKTAPKADGVVKRTRRTKAQMAALRAEEALEVV